MHRNSLLKWQVFILSWKEYLLSFQYYCSYESYINGQTCELFFPLFLQNTTVENAQSSTPIVINDAVAGEMAVFAVAVSENGLSPILHPVSLSAEADFIPR